MAATIGTETGAVLVNPAAPSRTAAGLRSILLPIGLALFVLAAWQIYVTVANIPAVILPSPISIVLMSPGNTQPYQTLLSGPSTTLPRTVAFFATKAARATSGVLPRCRASRCVRSMPEP